MEKIILEKQEHTLLLLLWLKFIKSPTKITHYYHIIIHQNTN